jgi:neutral ceramidase
MGGPRASFTREDITPEGQVSLLGYFTDRRSEGVVDRLHCRLACLSHGKERLLFVQVDSCLFGSEDAARLAAAASRASGVPVEAVIVFASHTHTAPGLADLYAVRRDAAYLDFLESRIRQAAARLGAGEAVQVRICRARAPGLASNRRWWLSDGTVATNPPRMHPSLVRPEGPVDDEVNTVAFLGTDGSPRCLFVSVSNHVDTMGGTLVSADWPGIMEAEIGASLGAPIVIPFIGAAGNINHFDFTRTREQTSSAETRRIGSAYAAAVLGSLDAGEPARGEPLRAARRVLRVPGIEITDAEKDRARAAVDAPARPARTRDGSGGDLTAEDLFVGDPEVERIFARALLELAARRPEAYEVPLQLLRIGGIGFFAIPGEPFVEIGLALKRLPGFQLAVPVGLANGYLGYIPLQENFGRGGYEARPGPALLGRGAAAAIIDSFATMGARGD